MTVDLSGRDDLPQVVTIRPNRSGPLFVLKGKATEKRGRHVQLPDRRRGARPYRAGCQLLKEGSLMSRRIAVTVSTLLAVPALVVPMALVATAPTAVAAPTLVAA